MNKKRDDRNVEPTCTSAHELTTHLVKVSRLCAHHTRKKESNPTIAPTVTSLGSS